MSSKKVLVLTTTYPTFLEGDATPPFVHELTKRLAAQWLEMIVLAPRRPWTKTYEEQDGVKIYRYPYFFRSRREKLADGAILPNLKKHKWLAVEIPFLIISCFWWVRKLVKKEWITCIHAHRIFSNWFVWALYKRFLNKRIELICTSHGSDLHTLSGGVVDRLKRWTIAQCDKVTVVSQYLKNNLDELMWYTTDAKVISMGVDEEKFHPRYYDENLKKQYGITGKFLLFVWRLAPEKGVEDLLYAMQDIAKNYDDIKLLIIGHGPLFSSLRKTSDRLWLANHVVFVGAIANDELPRYYATADLLIAPSKKESFGLVQLEAIMSWTPVLTNEGLWSVDLVKNWLNGYIVHNYELLEVCVQTVLTHFQKNKDGMKELIRLSVFDQYSWWSISVKYFNELSQEKKKTILYAYIDRPGGANRYFEILLKHLQEQDNIIAHNLVLPRFFEMYYFFIPFYLFYKWVDLSIYDVIHSDERYAHYFKVKNVKLIVTLHHNIFDANFQWNTSLLQKIFHRFIIHPNLKKTLRVADKLVAVSEYTKSSYESMFWCTNVIRIYNWVDTCIYKNLWTRIVGRSAIRIIYLWNHTRRKWRALLPQIMEGLGDGFEMYYTGKNEMLEEFRMYNLWRLSEHDLVMEYNSADMLILPSRLEGFWYVLAEAIACNLPVVTYNYSSMPEIVLHGENWYLVNEYSAEAFISAIKCVISSKLCIKNGVEYIDRVFGLRRMIYEYSKIYD